MSDSFVDLSYRGLALARRVKLVQVKPSSGYVEMPTPMPVGTKVSIAADDGVAIEATVAEIHELVTGATQAPGMLVRPVLEGAGATWWKARITAPDVDPEELRRTDPMLDTTIVAVPEVIEDVRDTGVMDALQDDGKSTMMMDAVDLAALGLDPNARPSGELTAVAAPIVDDDPEPETKSPTNNAKAKTKRKKR
ncbi:MAG: hypothetical protein JO257_01360 [Deltaproteobacteria bacterium]|nr:hypothetical protein [Deltaproteobacteria bacterium]